MGTLFPAINLPAAATPWAKRIQSALQSLERTTDRIAKAESNRANGVSSVLSLLSRQVAVLSAVANGTYAEWNNASGVTFTGWYSNPAIAQVQISSPTGRLEVGFGGSLNSGNGVFCYSITGSVSGTVVARTTVLANYAQRVALSGGASFTPSAFNTVTIAVPPDETLTVSLEMNGFTSGVYFYGGRISARPAP